MKDDRGWLIIGDARKAVDQIESGTIDACITSPPYFQLRNYGHPEQIGAEATLEEYVHNVCTVFDHVRRVLSPTGTLWINLGDTYRKKRLLGVPWKVAFELVNRGWILRQDIVWAKPNPVPEPSQDRCTRAHEMVFMFAKQDQYYYDAHAIREPNTPDMIRRAAKGHVRGKGSRDTSRRDGKNIGAGACVANGRNRLSVWSVPVEGSQGDHFAAWPRRMARRMIRAAVPVGGTVLDPFFGSGTTGMVAESEGRKWVGIEISEGYETLIKQRCAQRGLL